MIAVPYTKNDDKKRLERITRIVEKVIERAVIRMRRSHISRPEISGESPVADAQRQNPERSYPKGHL